MGLTKLWKSLGLVRPFTLKNKIKVGVCAMDKKARSKPIEEIVARIIAYGEFDVLYFGDECILTLPIEEWPQVDCLLSWHSDGFPLKKAQAYSMLRKPYLINDLLSQDVLMDRRDVYRKLVEHNIPLPCHIIVDREDGHDPEGFIETEDYVELNGARIQKPFVEKPSWADDHNVHIYYPHSMGGGVKRLFRKVDNKSSQYDSSHPGTVRRDGSYIYEEFLPTGGTDVKVYTVGPRYAHAEARKSPVVDGKVLRTADGKELRFPVLLSPQEKEIACKVVNAFQQNVCGFDLLRSEKGKSYVCDVNGWSHVKNSKRYYDDTAGILRSLILGKIAPQLLAAAPNPKISISSPAVHGLADDDAALLNEASYDDSLDGSSLGIDAEEMEHTDNRSQSEELRCVLAVIRHGDRTPKQKLKLKLTDPTMISLFSKYKDSRGKQAKLKSPNQLQELLDVTRDILHEKKDDGSDPVEVSELAKDAQDEVREKLRIVRTVLEQNAFNGINRKAQLKPTKWKVVEVVPDPESPTGAANGGKPSILEIGSSPEGLSRLLSSPSSSMRPNELLPAPSSVGGAPVAEVEELMLILKWGGVLTHAGRSQAEELGKVFRMVMYPRYGSAGGGLLRLHSTYRHDLKIYSSDEGRVQASAAAFTMGLLDLEGESLTPILVSLVKKDASMLEAFGKGASEDIKEVKEVIYRALTEKQVVKQAEGCKAGHISSVASEPVPIPSSAIDSQPDSPFATYPGTAAATSEGGGFPGSGSGAAIEGGRGPLCVKLAVDADGESVHMHIWSLDSSSGGALKGGSTVVPNLPENPLELLHKLKGLMKVLIARLRELCLLERDAKGQPAGRFSSLSQDPSEWALVTGQPCSGERMLLMFDRWNKLLKSFYNEKKDTFDISKVPDIYDSCKFDAIHNTHLGLPNLGELFTTAKTLADAVIPNEYGLDPSIKLSIGAKICSELLGKLLCDMAAMREESMASETPSVAVTRGDTFHYTTPEHDAVKSQLESDLKERAKEKEKGEASGAELNSEGSTAADGTGADDGTEPGSCCAAAGDDADEGDDEDNEVDDDAVGNETIHRLAPNYASDTINSPDRHVRTRIYFTSESHIHSLVNVLRFCHLRHGPSRLLPMCPRMPLLRPEAMATLDKLTELDYLTQIVFRMYENKAVPVDSPSRFRIEILFSSGANYSPFEVVPIKQDHMLPVVPRIMMHRDQEDGGITLSDLEDLLCPMAKTAKFAHNTNLPATCQQLASNFQSASLSAAVSLAATIGNKASRLGPVVVPQCASPKGSGSRTPSRSDSSSLIATTPKRQQGSSSASGTSTPEVFGGRNTSDPYV